MSKIPIKEHPEDTDKPPGARAASPLLPLPLPLPVSSSLGSLASSAVLKISLLVYLARVEPLHGRQSANALQPLPFLAPAWSKGSHVAAAHIRQGNLEAMQWVAFLAMVLDHIGFFMPAWGYGESIVLRGIGRIAYPMFSFVFAWRLSAMLWREPGHNVAPMIFRLFCCALAAHIAWAATGAETAVNVVVGFLGALVIVTLLQEDRGWHAPLGLRLVLATAIAHWVATTVDFGVAGLLLTLAFYSFTRFDDAGARNTALAALVVLTVGFEVHAALLALPVIYLIHRSSWSVKKAFPGFFYIAYPMHVLALAIITAMVMA